MLKTVLKFAAAAYFLWMAWTLLGLKLHDEAGSERPMRVHEAALFQWINPKAWAMAVSLVALVVDPGPGAAVDDHPGDARLPADRAVFVGVVDGLRPAARGRFCAAPTPSAILAPSWRR